MSSQPQLSNQPLSPVSNQRPVRRHLSDRQVDTVDRLVDAAVIEVRLCGYDQLTVRNVAKRAGVAAATAYTYFASKDHLVTEVFWRRLQALPAVHPDGRRTPVSRVGAALREVTLLVADEPELAAACTSAMLSNDPDVEVLRQQIGLTIHDRLLDAMGDAADPSSVRVLELMLSGAMLQAGMGYIAYDDLPDRIDETAALVVTGADRRTDTRP